MTMITNAYKYAPIKIDGPFSIRYTEIDGKPLYLIGDNHDYYCKHIDNTSVFSLEEFLETLLREGYHLIIEALDRNIAPAYPELHWGYGDSVSMPRVMRHFDMWYADISDVSSTHPMRVLSRQITSVDNIRYLMSYDRNFDSWERQFIELAIEGRQDELISTLNRYATRYMYFYNPNEFWFITNTDARKLLRAEYEKYTDAVREFVNRFGYEMTPQKQLKKHFKHLIRVLLSMNPDNFQSKLEELGEVFVGLHETIVDYTLMYEFVRQFESLSNTGVVVFAGYEHIESLQKFIDTKYCKDANIHCVTSREWLSNYDSDSDDGEFHVDESLAKHYESSGTIYPCPSTVRRQKSP